MCIRSNLIIDGQGKGIQISAKKLNVESLQDTATYKSKQQNVTFVPSLAGCNAKLK